MFFTLLGTYNFSCAVIKILQTKCLERAGTVTIREKVSGNFFLSKQNLPKSTTVKLGIKELFDKEQIGIKEPFSMINLPFTT